MAICTICQRAHATANHARLVRRGAIRVPARPGAAPTPAEAAAATPTAVTQPLGLDAAGIIQAINNLAGLLAPTDSHVITFSRSIPAATANVEQQRIPFDANILAVFIHFPPGTNQLVEVRLVATINGALHYIVPTKEDAYIALDDSFIPFQGLRFAMPAGSVLQAEWYNYDGANAHTVPITVVIGIAGRVGGVALPPSEFIPVPERPRVPPTVAPESTLQVKATSIQSLPEGVPLFPPVPPLVIPRSPTSPAPTAPPSINSLGVSISPRTTRANPSEPHEVTLNFTSNKPAASSATDVSVPLIAKVFLIRNNVIVQDYGRVSFDLRPGQTTPINMRLNAPKDAGLYNLRIIAGLQSRFNENTPSSWLTEQVITNMLEVVALSKPVAKPVAKIQPGTTVTITLRPKTSNATISGDNAVLIFGGSVISSAPLNSIAPFNSTARKVTFKIPEGAPSGFYDLEIRQGNLAVSSYRNIVRI